MARDPLDILRSRLFILNEAHATLLNIVGELYGLLQHELPTCLDYIDSIPEIKKRLEEAWHGYHLMTPERLEAIVYLAFRVSVPELVKEKKFLQLCLRCEWQKASSRLVVFPLTEDETIFITRQLIG
jgi:hypothetical protein